MKAIIILCVVLAAVTNGLAQQPTPEPDTVPPVKQTDPEVKHLPEDAHYIGESLRVGTEDLPPAIITALKGPEYHGWEKSVIYKNKSSEIYTIDIREGGKSRIYRFTKEGKRLKDPPGNQ